MTKTTISEFKGQYAFLSNFYIVEAGIDLVAYHQRLRAPTTEHLFQALKSEREVERNYVLQSPTARVAKYRGRTVTLREDWEQVKNQAMRAALNAKFSSEHPDLRKRLLDTGEAVLIEGNTWGDTYWGVDLRTGKGANHLGLELVALRSRIAQSTPNFH